MLSNETAKENSKEKAFTEFTILPKYVFWIGSLSSVQILISVIFFYDELFTLGLKPYATSVLLMLLPCLIISIAAIIGVSPFACHSLKHITNSFLKKKSTFYIDMLASSKEQVKPTKSFYKVSRVLIWGLSICSVVGIFASAIYMIIVLLQG